MGHSSGAKRPKVAYISRYFPHYRHPVFRLLMDRASHLDVRFVHTSKIPAGMTDVSRQEFPNTHLVKLFNFGPFSFQPGSLAFLWKENPDVTICGATITSLSFHLCGLLQRLRGKKVIYWSKGPSPKQQPKWRSAINAFVFRIYSCVAHALIGYGEASKQWFVKHGWSGSKVIVAQNAVDTSDLLASPEEWQQRAAAWRSERQLDDCFLVGIVSRLIPSKKVDMLIEAVSRVQEKRGDLALVIAGGGPQADELKQLAEKSSARVEVLGRVPEGEDNLIFAASDVCAFPGAVGLAIVQSMALGKPTLIADEPYADSELVVHESTGLRFARGDVQALADALDRLHQEPALRERLGAAARQHILDHATIENMVERILEAIHLVLPQDSASGVKLHAN